MYSRIAVGFVAVMLAVPTHAITIDLNVDLVGITQTSASRSAGPFGLGWEQTTTSGGSFPTYSLSPTTDHFLEFSIPWSTSNWNDFTRPLKPPAPVTFRYEASPDPSFQQVIPIGNTSLDFQRVAAAGRFEGAALEVTPDPTALFVSGGGGAVEFLDPSDFLPYDVVDFGLSRSFSVAEPDGHGGFFFLASTATAAAYVFAGGELIRLDATRQGQLIQLFFDGDILESVATPEGPLSDGDFVRDRSGLLFEVGRPIWEGGLVRSMSISDDTFAAPDWSALVVEATGGATQQATFPASGGNPDAYREMEHLIPGVASIEVFHAFEPMTFTPSVDGPILEVHYAEDRIEFDPPFSGAAVGAAPALLQDGIVYAGPNATYTDTSWTSLEMPALLAEDFDDRSGLHPDFSELGSQIQFGFIRRNSSQNPSSTHTITSGIDNWSFELVYLPEPTTAAGVGVGSALLAMLSRNRSRLRERRIQRET